MTNPTPHGQVPAIQRYKIGYHSDEWGVRSLSPTGIYDDAGPWVRYEDHAAQIAALRAQQPAPATQQAGEALSDDLRDRLVAISEAVAYQDDRAAQAMLREILAAPQPPPTPQADSQPAATGRIAELEDALSSCLQLVNQLNEHHIPDGCSRLIRHIKDAAATVSKAQASAPADSVTAPAGGAEEVDKALNDYAQAFMARAMGWTRENGDAMPDARTKLYSAISSYARGLFTTSPHAPGRQPAPEYVGNGMFKGETIEKAAEHWANWCDRRCMNGLAEFLRVVAARAPADSVTAPAGPSKSLPYEPTSAMLIAARERDPALPIETVRAIYWSMWRTAPTPPAPAADSVLEDAARWQWLADYLIGERTDLDEGIVACATIDALRQFADAARKQGANHG